MWYIFNAMGERCFAVNSEKEAIAKLDDWYTHYMYIDEQACQGGAIMDIDIVWNDEELEELEELNEIFNLQEERNNETN